MKVIIISDAHLFRTKDGQYWCNTAVHGYEFWKRYTEVFEDVRVIARVKEVEYNESFIKADGPGVKIIEVPFVRGASQYILHFFKINRALKRLINDEDIAIFRVPSFPAYLLLYHYRKTKKPYAFEVVVDPVDCYAKNKLAKWWMAFVTKKECMRANGVSYVTQFFLEKRYPCKALINGDSTFYFTSYYSSINLNSSFFYKPRVFDRLKKIRIIHVASIINDEVKGHEVVIKTTEKLIEKGYDVKVSFIGDGLLIPKYKSYIEQKGLDNNIFFLGLFSSKDDIRTHLINSDLFFFPTKAEGLPRVLIEAMATGLPCLSTPVNGIPELLDSEYMLNPNDVEGFAAKIEQLMNTPDELTQMSKKNISVAYKYVNEELQKRRNVFYSKLYALGSSKNTI